MGVLTALANPFFALHLGPGGFLFFSFLFFSKSWTFDTICCRNFFNCFLYNTPSAIIGAFISYRPFTFFWLIFILFVFWGGFLARQIPPLFFGFFTFSRAKSSMIVFLFLFLFFSFFPPPINKPSNHGGWLRIIKSICRNWMGFFLLSFLLFWVYLHMYIHIWI